MDFLVQHAPPGEASTVEEARAKIHNAHPEVDGIEVTDEARSAEFVAKTRAHIAILDWLELRTGTREGHDELAMRVVQLIRAAVPRKVG